MVRMLIVICGPIASGKSTVARAVARLFGADSAVIDLDLVYEMLEHDGAPKTDSALWCRARRAAAALADALLHEHARECGAGVVVVEGDFLTAEQRAEFVNALRTPVVPSFVTLVSPIGVALQRVREDPLRGLSRDPGFLRRHYQELEDDLRNRPATDLVVDTASIDVEEAARVISEWASGCAND
jgi:chloramphenicol 3-O-phosphotransferase